MDTGLLELTRRVRRASAELPPLEKREPDQCVIPGCKYTAPLGKYCGYHSGRELASRKAKAEWARKF